MLNEKDEMKTPHFCFALSSQISQSHIFLALKNWNRSRLRLERLLCFSRERICLIIINKQRSLDCALLCYRSRSGQSKKEVARKNS